MSGVFQDLRVVARQLAQKPMFTLVAVLTLAVGMGVNTVAFSVINGLLFKGAATAAQEDVGRIITTPGGDEEGNASLPEFERFKEATAGVVDLAAEGRSSLAWNHDGDSERVYVLFVTDNYFSMVRPQVLAGHLSLPGVEGRGPSAIIGERFWREKLGAPSLHGLTLRLNQLDVVVTGIMREAFTGPAGLYSPDLWLRLKDLPSFRTASSLMARETRWLFLFGRMQSTTDAAAVRGHLETAVAAMAREWPDTHAGRGATFRLISERNSEFRSIAFGGIIGMGVIALILLLACFNVANLLLARALERERDMGIRTAIGASPARLMRLAVLEGVVFAAMSGALALVLAWWTQSLMATFAIPIDVPQHIDFTLDARVIGFIVLLIAIAGVLPGLWPALAAARTDVMRVMTAQSGSTAGSRPSRLRRGLVGAQVAGATAFLAVALLFLQSYTRLLDTDVGFARYLVVAEIDPASQGYTPDATERYVEDAVARVAVLPGVTAVALIDRAPFFVGFDRQTAVAPAERTCADGGCPAVATYAIGRGYFAATAARMIAGREFGESQSHDVIIVNQPLADTLWPEGNALGRTVRLGGDGRIATVVGIVGTTRIRGLGREVPSLFVPLEPEQLQQGVSLVVRSASGPAGLVRPVHEAIAAIDREVPVVGVKTMEQRMAVQLWPFRTLSATFSICGVLALILSVVGLAGVVVHAVSQRTREFGVRLSIGATPRDLASDVLRGSLRLLGPGLVLGLIAAALAARAAQALFVGVDVLNPLTYFAVAALQGAVVVMACLVPAVRASRVDPLNALRTP